MFCAFTLAIYVIVILDVLVFCFLAKQIVVCKKGCNCQQVISLVQNSDQPCPFIFTRSVCYVSEIGDDISNMDTNTKTGKETCIDQIYILIAFHNFHHAIIQLSTLRQQFECLLGDWDVGVRFSITTKSLKTKLLLILAVYQDPYINCVSIM